MTRRYGIAIVGAGIGERHAVAVQRLASLFEVTAIVDRNTARAEALAGSFAAQGLARPRVVADYDDPAAVADDVDVVSICLPPFLHGAAIRHALEAGKHVVCEKPLVGSLAELDDLGRLAERLDRRLMPIFQYRFGHGLAKARHLVETGVAGKLYLASIETHWTRGADYYAVPWRGRTATELGGVFAGHAIHAHDMLTHLAGEIRTVSAATAVRVNAVETEDCAGALFEMADGAIAVSSATLGSADEISRLRLCFENLTMVSSLAPYTPNRDPWTFLAKAPTDQATIDAALRTAPLGSEGYTEQFERFHAALESGGPLPITLADARRSIELLTALYHSARTGTRVALPLGPEHPAHSGWIDS